MTEEQRTGQGPYEDHSLSAEAAADRLGMTGKALRSWLRVHRPEGAVQVPPQKNGRWYLDEELVAVLEAGRPVPARTPPAGTTAHPGPVLRPESTQPSCTDETVIGEPVTVDSGEALAGPGRRALAWSDWVPFADVLAVAPRSPGVYMMRLTAEPERGPVYIGMAGERKGNGVRGRLAIYVSGQGAASGLGEHAFDRALADPDWVEARLVEAREGRSLRAKRAARAAIDHLGLEVRWTPAATRAEALLIESQLIGQYRGRLWNR